MVLKNADLHPCTDKLDKLLDDIIKACVISRTNAPEMKTTQLKQVQEKALKQLKRKNLF